MSNKLISIGVIASLILGIIGISKPAQVVEKEAPIVGALTGPDINYPYLAVSGVRREFRSMELVSSTTPCALQSPSATSTLEHLSVEVRTASSTATTWTFAKASTAFATTTRLNVFSLSSGVLGTMVGTSTPTGVTAVVDDTNVFGPNTWAVVGVAGTAIADSTKLNGACKAIFTVTS